MVCARLLEPGARWPVLVPGLKGGGEAHDDREDATEYRDENHETNDHGRLEIKSAPKKHHEGKEYMGLIHMEPPAARLWSRVLINAVSEQFAAGALQRDLGVANVKCARYGLGLVSSIGYEGGTKMRAMLISESLLKRPGLAEEGRQPVYEVPGHHVAWPLVLRG